MPDKKLTDNEIVKALECCIKSNHFGECFENECPFISEQGCKVGKETLYPYALDLINRQKAEIDRLSDRNHKCIYLSDDETTEYCVDGPCPKFKTEPQIKAEAYKEFAEKVKLLNQNNLILWNEQIDNLLKEKVGAEDNG